MSHLIFYLSVFFRVVMCLMIISFFIHAPRNTPRDLSNYIYFRFYHISSSNSIMNISNLEQILNQIELAMPAEIPITVNYYEYIATICGYIGAVLIGVANIPQIVRNLRLKSCQVNIGMICIIAMANVCFMMNVILTDINYDRIIAETVPIFIASVCSTISCIVILIQHCRYEQKKTDSSIIRKRQTV